jgi:hypothetical protein
MPERVYLLGKHLSIHKIFTFTQYTFDRLFHTPSRFYQDERAFLQAKQREMGKILLRGKRDKRAVRFFFVYEYL